MITVNDTWTGLGTGGTLSSTGPHGTADPREATVPHVYSVTKDTRVRVVWTGQALRVYSDHLATATIGEGLLECDWFGTLRPLVQAPTGPTPSSTEGLIASLKAESGLTWEQIARALGVSKRTVLLWAGGARVSNKNHELFLSLKELIDSIDGTPDERRNVLLAPSPNRPSALTVWVQSKTGAETRINAPVLAAHELLG